MIERLKRFLETHLEGSANAALDQDNGHQLAVAATALMLQVAQVDAQEDEQEIALILQLAGKVHDLTEKELQDLLAIAREKTLDATSMYEFTRVINDRCQHQERLQLVVSLWQVALADHEIHKYEEHLIRRVADLLYLTPAEFVQCRHRAQQLSQTTTPGPDNAPGA
ncbi:MAG: TerB family tellurite resistance protein [Halomonadaceae bacterium]|nr:MAG: TerB family tellurite resistance protein [Halomonadaceae bacterium]